MHGRVKVRTTAEQELIKKAEKEKKALEFRKGIDYIFQKRKNNEWDEELLNLTGKILVYNPDVYTLWNIRRECILNNKWSPEEYADKLEKELVLTETSLRENPKSYCVWHQRVWIIEKLPSPNWKRELELCNKCLNLDERNFHCWTYRQYAVNKSNVPDEEELNFTTLKISNNFSNYSSWHYRSKLLKKLYPSNVNDLPIRDDIHNTELDLVMNATFTDPNDSSTWFYHRWLLNYWKQTQKFWCAMISKSFITISFHLETDSSFKLYVNNEQFECKWKSANGKKSSYIWECDLKTSFENVNDKIELKFENNVYTFEPLSKSDFICYGNKVNKNNSNPKLIEQLNNYEMLSQMEPNNKWSRLTSVQLMMNINFIKYYKNILDEINKLINIDSIRTNYYKDLRSKCLLEKELYQLKNENNCINEIQNINLSNLELTSISSQEPYFTFFKTVNFSNNFLANKLYQLWNLRQCTVLDLSNNGIIFLKSFPMLPNLKVLTLANNKISSCEEVLNLINKLKSLKKLDIKDNPLDNNKDSFLTNLKNNFAFIEIII